MGHATRPKEQAMPYVMPRVDAALKRRIGKVRAAQEMAERAPDMLRDLVWDLKSDGWQQREIAYVLGVSPQRVSQLVKPRKGLERGA